MHKNVIGQPDILAHDWPVNWGVKLYKKQIRLGKKEKLIRSQ